MGSTLVRWTLPLGLGNMLLLVLPLFPFAGTASSVNHAAEQASLLDINTVTQQSSACSLLTLSDIEIATGAKAGDPHPNDTVIFEGPTKGEPVHVCMWTVAAHKGQVAISIGRLPAGVSAEAVAKHNPAIDTLRARGWTVEEKDFGNAWCSIMTPPAPQPNGLMMSICSAGVKDMILSVVFTSPTKKLSIEQAKALLDKAIGRQP